MDQIYRRQRFLPVSALVQGCPVPHLPPPTSGRLPGMAGPGAAVSVNPTLDRLEVNILCGWLDLLMLPRPNRNQQLLPLGRGLGLRLP